ncbi:MAG: Hsp70 family protein [Chlamydiales bacterium]|nr:Hsp70 family protein [Chlamydiales bacterium]
MYYIGIDLGTTNSAVAYSDGGALKLFRIPQLTASGMIEPLPTLPSFCYLADPSELPGSDFAVGEWAREQGAKTPTRLIQSAKSWLACAAASRKEKILPFEAADEKRRLSPVEASANYLRHIREAWNEAFPGAIIEEQDVSLTVPASFDEVARALTVEAARMAGIPHLTLLEEPQAAFYNWLEEHQNTFDEGETILVCDVGGGTTDFSLIEVTSDGFRRMAVGKHLLLGGDNMDAALCHYLETRLHEELDRTQWLSLRHQTRVAKEAILKGEKREKRASIWIPGKGSQVVGGGKGVELTAEEVESILLEGFFGLYDFDEARRLARGSGIRQMGLPYEREPSITKHLAAFLSRSSKPTYLLFNGGSMKPLAFQNRIKQSIDRWFPEGNPVEVLPSSTFDLAVARGAAYFGKARSGAGFRIGGGIPRGYYLEIDAGRVVTLLPRGTEKVSSEETFSLLPNTPVSFQLYHSHTRLGDEPGSILPCEEEEMTPLPPIQTVLRFGSSHQERIPVKLSIELTEIGTLELWLSSQISEHKWKLEFQMDGYTKEERLDDETYDTAFLEPAKQALIDAFAVGGQAKLKVLMPTLESVIERPRNEWSPSILRGLFEPLLAQQEKRTLAPSYESRFWNLAGFLLRPGRGYPLDDYRIRELWKLILSDSKKGAVEEVQIQKWICYRRIAPGLSKGQQMQIFSELFPLVYDKKKRRLIVKRKGGYAYTEQMRVLAALELVDTPLKVRLGEALVERIVCGNGESCDFWALGRIGARALLYGSAAHVIAPNICEEWIARLTKISDPQLAFPLSLLARKTDCRALNLSSATVEKVKIHLGDSDLSLLTHEGGLTLQQQEKCFGDTLPHGLLL